MAEQQPSPNPSTQDYEQSEPSTYGIWISNKVDSWSRIRSSLYSIAPFVHNMSPSYDAPTMPMVESNNIKEGIDLADPEFKSIEEGIGFDHVERFYTFLSNFYRFAVTWSIDPDRNRWQVTKISTFKSNKPHEHECVVADVVGADITVYLRIERKLPLFSKRQKPTSDSGDDRPRPSSGRASDEITYSLDLKRVVQFEHEHCVDLIKFPAGKGLTLPQIALLTYCVKSVGEAYNLFEGNCYWFAHITIETAKLIQPDFTEELTRDSWRGVLPTKKPTPEDAKRKYHVAWATLNKDARFLRIMSSTSNLPMAEFNDIEQGIGFNHVEGFYIALLNFYISAATFWIDSNRNRWKVTRISTYKSNKSVEHEFVVADVVCGKTTVFLRIERKLHLSKIGNLFSKKLKPTSKAQMDGSEPDTDTHPLDEYDDYRPRPRRDLLSNTVSDQISYSQDIKHVVQFKYDKYENCVDYIHFPAGKWLTLPQIAVLASAVNSMGQNLFVENSYWFPHVMIEAAKLIQPDCTEVTISKRKLGSWGGAKKPTPELIKKAKGKFDKAWAAFDKDISDTINNRNSEIYKAAEQELHEAETEHLKALLAKSDDSMNLFIEEQQKRSEADPIAEKEKIIKQLKALLAA